MPVEAFELGAHDRVVLLEQLGPALVADFDRVLGRLDDVGEDDRGEHSVAFGTPTHAGEELLHLIEELVAVGEEEEVRVARAAR